MSREEWVVAFGIQPVGVHIDPCSPTFSIFDTISLDLGLVSRLEKVGDLSTLSGIRPPFPPGVSF